MPNTLQTNNSDAMVLLKAAHNQFCGKEYDGEKMSPRAEIKFWVPSITQIDDIEKLHKVVATLNKQTSFCIVRGMLKDQEHPRDERVLRRCKKEEDPFTEAPRRWLAIDHDGVDISMTGSLEDQVHELISWYPPEFAAASCVYQATSRYGIEEGLFIRLFWLLEEETDNGHLKAYLAQYPELKMDTSLYSPVQPHYTASPRFPDSFEPPISMAARVGVIDNLVERVDLAEALSKVQPKIIEYTEVVEIKEGNDAQIHHAIENLLQQDPGDSRHHSMMGCMIELVALGCPAQQAIAFGYEFLAENGREPNSPTEVEDAFAHAIAKAKSGEAKVNVERLDETFPDYEEGEDVLPEGEENDMDAVLGYNGKIKYAYSNAQTFMSINYPDGGLIRWNQEHWEWRNGCYFPMEEEEMNACLTAETQFGPSVVTSIEKSLIGINFKKGLVPGRFLDNRPTEPLVVFKNGMLGIHELIQDRFQDLQKHTPDYFNTHQLGFNYDPKAVCPTWDSFLIDCFGEDKAQIREFQKMMGYILTGDKSQQKFFVMQGASRCGKGTVADVMRQLMGEDNCAPMMLSALSGDFALAGLVGKSLWLIDEVNEQNSKYIDGTVVDLIKSQVGGSRLSVNRKRKDILQNVTLDGRIVISCNRLPGFLDPSGALAARMVVFRFVNSFVGRENFKLGKLLTNELAGIFNWALQGVVHLMEDGTFITPKAVEELVEMYQEVMSPMGAFAKECFQPAADSQIKTTDAYHAYKVWAHKLGRHPVSMSKFGLELTQSNVAYMKKRKLVDGERGNYYCGIVFTIEGDALLKGDVGFG